MASEGTVVDRGLEGIVVGSTGLTHVEGSLGRLRYRGYDIAELATHASFEEVCYLLLFGELPNAFALDDFAVRIAANRSLPPQLLGWLAETPPDACPMDVLRTTLSALALFAPHSDDGSHVSNPRAAIQLLAKMPTIVAAWSRIRSGKRPIEPLPDLSIAANFLYMRTGRMPEPEVERAFDIYCVLLADNSFSASTFNARIAASTRADIFASVTSALATLQGDLHGGAPAKVMRTMLEIGTPDRAEAHVRALLERGERIMGMGHREFRAGDPRALHLETLAKALSEASGSAWYAVARAFERAAGDALRERKPGNEMHANVEFYSAPLLYELGIAPDEFACVLACARMAGWCAHVLEQLANNRLIRPRAAYNGPPSRAWVSIERRVHGPSPHSENV